MLVSAKSTRQELGTHFFNQRREARRGLRVTKKIDDKRYVVVRRMMKKSDADDLAEKYRRMGYLARVTSETGYARDWDVFVWHRKE